MIEIDVMKVLLVDAATKDFVGENIFMMEADEGTLAPYITFQTVYAERSATLVSGKSKNRGARIQFDCYAPTILVAKKMAEAVSNALVSANKFKAIYLSDQDAWDPSTDLKRTVLEMSISQTDA